MKIGITYDLKTETGDGVPGSVLPDDSQEEYDSPVTIDAIGSVLRGLGHEVVRLGDGRALLEKLLADPPDFVFSYAEGHGISRSREARVPAVLEMLGIPYSGSDPLTLAATLDKDCARRLASSAGLAVPSAVMVETGAKFDQVARSAIDSLHFPVLIKPAWEGSSKGICRRSLVHAPNELAQIVQEVHAWQKQPILIEEFIEGDEITVGVLGNDPPRIMGAMRVRPNTPTGHFVYSLEIKRDFRRLVTYDYPPPISNVALENVRRATLQAYRTFGCRDVARIDFRMRGDTPYFIEANPIPGLHPEDSDLVIMAKLMDWTYEHLVTRILDAAFGRCFGKRR